MMLLLDLQISGINEQLRNYVNLYVRNDVANLANITVLLILAHEREFITLLRSDPVYLSKFIRRHYEVMVLQWRNNP